jgi:hypothetical protein
MHMDKTRVVFDALPIRVGQEIALPSGRPGIVKEIERDRVIFQLAETPKHLSIEQQDSWTVSLPRRLVAELIK